MKSRKKLKQIASCVLVSLIALIIGYTILIPNEKTDGKNSPLAVYLQDGQTYTKSIIKNFDEILDDYEYDHIDCGSAAENAKWTWNNGALSATGINAHTTCKLYFDEKALFKISSITVDGNSVASVPTSMNYHVGVDCGETATASWNYANWSLDVSATNATKSTCSLAFTTITSSNLASKFTTDSSSGKYLNTYIKSLLGNGTSVSAGESGNTLENLGTTNGTAIILSTLNSNPTYTALASANDYGTECYNGSCTSTYTQLSDKYTFSNNKWSNTAAMSSQTYNRITIPSDGFYKLYWTNSNTSASYTFYARMSNSTTTATSGYDKTTEQEYDYGYLNAGDYIDIYATSSDANQITFYLKKSINDTSTTYYHDIGIRYVGPNPNNYIKFNNELWRIIGIFREAKTTSLTGDDTYYTKIIRNESIGGYPYNAVGSTDGWWSKSNGAVSTLNYLLNHYYIGAGSNDYNGTGNINCKFYSTTAIARPNCDYSVIGIQPGWREMIRSTTWYTAAGVDSSTASTSFSGERGSAACKAGGDLSYSAKVGLMYPSDYLYSGSGAASRWLLQNGYDWTISPGSRNASAAWFVTQTGDLYDNSVHSGYAVRPAVYLSSEVYITGGSGTMLDPYIINGA